MGRQLARWSGLRMEALLRFELFWSSTSWRAWGCEEEQALAAWEGSCSRVKQAGVLMGRRPPAICSAMVSSNRGAPILFSLRGTIEVADVLALTQSGPWP